MVIAGRFCARGQIERFTHPGFDKGVVDGWVTLSAGVDADIASRVGVVGVQQAVSFGRWKRLYAIAGIYAADQQGSHGNCKNNGYAVRITDATWKISLKINNNFRFSVAQGLRRGLKLPKGCLQSAPSAQCSYAIYPCKEIRKPDEFCAIPIHPSAGVC